nr:lycopene beta-cyclase CrtY [uncultured Sphingomonas sp.]
MTAARYDLIILGGGLAGGLAALMLKRTRPAVRVLLIEAGTQFGGNHIWSFFDSDVADSQRLLLQPLIGHRWPDYEVRFPAFRRTIDTPYRSIDSHALDREVCGAMGDDALANAVAVAAAPDQVILNDGRQLAANAVLDCRGLAGLPEGLDCGWQKFCGQLLSVPAGHRLDRPVVMDATVDQHDGYRFLYCLPFSPTELFVEDTYYVDNPDLNLPLLRDRIARYGDDNGWKIAGVVREEAGVLPVVMDGDFDRFWPADDPLARGGVRGGLFHPLTSYSLPDAVQFAHWLARDAHLDGTLASQTRALARQHWRAGGFNRMLARMLFRAADPAARYKVLERFYRLSPSLIARFYAGRSTWSDRTRILLGRPPVPVMRALSAMAGRS